MEQPDFSTARWEAPGGVAGRNVEVAYVDGMVGLRDSASPEGPVLVFNDGEWRAFLAGIELGEFDIAEIAASTGGHLTEPVAPTRPEGVES